MGRAQPCADFFFGKKMGGKRWGLLSSAFFTAHLFAGPSPEFLKTSCIKYRAKSAQPCYRHNHPPTSDPAKKCAVKDGDFCAQHC